MSTPRRYLPGYTGTATINGGAVSIGGWAGSHDPGTWDATTPDDGGWMYQEAGIQKVTITCTTYVKLTDNAAVLPAFAAGQTIPCVFSIFGKPAYEGSFYVTKFDPKPDLKGGLTIDLSLDSQGALTGSLVPDGLVVAPPAQSGGSSQGGGS